MITIQLESLLIIILVELSNAFTVNESIAN